MSIEEIASLTLCYGSVHIYEKYGFHEIKLEDYEYARGDIAFEYTVSQKNPDKYLWHVQLQRLYGKL